MTPEVKQIISGKLADAITAAGITKTEAGRLLGFNNPVYCNFMLNPKYWEKAPKAAWVMAQRWLNSGETMAKYAEKREYLKDFAAAEIPEPPPAGEIIAGTQEQTIRSNFLRDFIECYQALTPNERSELQYIMNKLIRL